MRIKIKPLIHVLKISKNPDYLGDIALRKLVRTFLNSETLSGVCIPWRLTKPQGHTAFIVCCSLFPKIAN